MEIQEAFRVHDAVERVIKTLFTQLETDPSGKNLIGHVKCDNRYSLYSLTRFKLGSVSYEPEAPRGWYGPATVTIGFSAATSYDRAWPRPVWCSWQIDAEQFAPLLAKALDELAEVEKKVTREYRIKLM